MPRAQFLRTCWLTLLLTLVGVAGLRAQAKAAPDGRGRVDASLLGGPVILGPEWLFHAGDDPAWAAPQTDDSGWPAISTAKPLSDYGYRDLTFAWYRAHVRLPQKHTQLTVLIAYIGGSYEVYGNGVLLGSAGSWSGLRSRQQAAMWSFPIPEQAFGDSGNLTIALRVRVNLAGDSGSGSGQPLWGPSLVMLMDSATAEHEKNHYNSHQVFQFALDGALGLLVGAVSLALFWAMPGRKEYLFAGLFGIALGVSMAISVWNGVDAVTMLDRVPRDLMFFIESAAVLEFVMILVGQRKNWWIRTLEIGLLVTSLQNPWVSRGFTPLIGFYFGFAWFFAATLLFDFTVLGLLARSFRRNAEARVMLPPIGVLTFFRVWSFTNFLFFYLAMQRSLRPSPSVRVMTYEIGLNILGDILFLLALLVFLVLRTVGIARERARIGAELEAARTMQQLLLARDGKVTPGFQVESVYYPANEVGGDFFLVETNAAGALIAIVGDVSGKGLQAAMRVSMILGVLRREDSWEPEVVLRNLNEALRNSGQEGFTTACCVRIDADGSGVVANAGHIAPYLAGNELATPPALPLGLVAGLEYEPVAFALAAGQRLVLMSDGVVEARTSDGELLGFERVTRLMAESAAEIADAAKAFGQDDDITVLTIVRVGA